LNLIKQNIYVELEKKLEDNCEIVKSSNEEGENSELEVTYDCRNYTKFKQLTLDIYKTNEIKQ